LENRNLHIDTLRGIACIFLVAFHVIGVGSDSGLRIESGVYREINDLLAYIRMPLFTFLSGIVYAYRPFSINAGLYIKKKTRRLIVPMLVVGTSFAIIQYIVPGTNDTVDNWWLLHIIPVAHFWFIESIFIIFIIMIPLELIGSFNSSYRFLSVLICASLLYISNIYFVYFSVSGAIYLFPYFLLGMALQRYSKIKTISRSQGIILVMFTIALLTLISFDILPSFTKRSSLGLAVGMLGCVGLLSLRIKSAFLAKIGIFSYTIYLYHVFFTASTRMLLYKLDINNVELLFILALIMGILGPILTEQFFNGTNITRICMLGKSKLDESDLWFTKIFIPKTLSKSHVK